MEVIIPSIATIVGAIIGSTVPIIVNAIRGKNRQAYKFVYIKLYHLKKMEDGAPPACRRYISRLGREVDVFDEFHYFKVNIFKSPRKNWTVGARSRGVVDMQILHPFQRIAFSDIGAQEKEGSIRQVIKNKASAFFIRTMYYNGCQPGNENFAIKMESDTDEARIIVDFTAIPGFEKVVKGYPSGVIRRGDHEEDIAVGETMPGMFMVSSRKLEKWDVIRIDFSFDWE